jgi:hypothetical protein
LASAESSKRVTAATREPFKSVGRTLLTLGVDLATVKLTATLLVAYDLIGLVDLGEFCLRLRIILILVRMVLLRKLAKRRFTFFRLRRFGDAQHAIGIAHVSAFPRKREMSWDSAAICL